MAASGTNSHVSPNSTWRITTRKLPILKADPIEALSKDIGIPIPEMIFGDNYAQITHVPSGWTLNFNVRDALDRVGKTEEGMLQVAVAEEWKKERSHQEEVKQVVKPFDWSYTTDYRGTTTTTLGGEEGWRESSSVKDPIRTDLLSRQDPILFFDEVDLMEGWFLFLLSLAFVDISSSLLPADSVERMITDILSVWEYRRTSR